MVPNKPVCVEIFSKIFSMGIEICSSGPFCCSWHETVAVAAIQVVGKKASGAGEGTKSVQNAQKSK